MIQEPTALQHIHTSAVFDLNPKCDPNLHILFFFPEIWTSKDFDTANDKYKSLGWRYFCDYTHVCQICCLVPRPLSLTVQIRAQRKVGRRKKAVLYVPMVPRTHSNAKGVWRKQLHMGTFETHFDLCGERRGRVRRGGAK